MGSEDYLNANLQEEKAAEHAIGAANVMDDPKEDGKIYEQCSSVSTRRIRYGQSGGYKSPNCTSKTGKRDFYALLKSSSPAGCSIWLFMFRVVGVVVLFTISAASIWRYLKS